MEGSSTAVVNPMAEAEAGAEPGSPGGPALQGGKGPSDSASRLPEQMPTDAPGLQAFLQKSMAIRSESPLNLHQATTYFCLQQPDSSLALKLGSFVGSVVLVVVQIWVCVACIIGINSKHVRGRDRRALLNGMGCCSLK